MATSLNGYVATRPQGYRLHVYMAAWLQGYLATGLHWQTGKDNYFFLFSVLIS